MHLQTSNAYTTRIENGKQSQGTPCFFSQQKDKGTKYTLDIFTPFNLSIAW